MADNTQQNAPGMSGQAAPDGANDVLKENSEYKQFFEGISPLLSKLDSNPDLVTAILGDKISSEYAQAALEGKLTVKEAEVATQAAAAVVADIGKEKMEGLSKEDLAKLVDEKVGEVRRDFKEKEEQKEFEQYTEGFIKNTPDFENYSKEISEWLDEHDVTDVSVAYYAVKGQLSEKAAREQAAQEAAETAKGMILNAGPGGIAANATIDGRPLIDALVASHANANHI